MSLRNLLWFYRRRVRARAVQELLALVGIAIGVSLLFAVQISNRSLSASIAQLTHGLVGRAQLQLVARGPEGFDERMLHEVDAIDGVRAAAPLLQASVNLVGPRGERAATLLAADPRLAHMGGSLLSGYTAGRLASLRAAVLPAPIGSALGVHFGESVTLQVYGRVVQAPVGAIVGRGDVGVLADVPAIVMPLDYGQQIAGMDGRVSRIVVLADPARRAGVAAALERIAGGRIDVRGTDSDARLFAQAASPNDQSTALFASISAMVGFLFAFNAMLLMARERRRLIAELRMSGYGLAAVLEVVLFDALLLGIVASGVGLALGELLSRFIFHPSPGYLGIAFPVGTARVVDWQTILLSLLAGTVAAVLASLAPLVAAFRAPAMDSAVEDSVGGVDRSLRPVPLVTASAVCLSVTTVILLLLPSAANVGMAVLVASMLFVLPVALVSVLALAERQRRRIASVVPAIAIGELQSARTRSVAIAAIAAISVFGSTAIEGAHHDLQGGLDPNARELNAVADLWISPAGSSNTLATVPFVAGDAIAHLARVPQVTSVRVYRGSFLDMGDRRVWVIAPPRASERPFPASQLVDGDLASAYARVRAGGWAVLSQALARQRDLRVGQAFTLSSPVPTRLRLAAITTNFGWSPGTVVLNADDYERAWKSDDASAVQVDLAAGVSPDEGRRIVRRALGAESGLVVQTARERELRDRATTRDGLTRLTQIATLMLIAAALAMAAAMAGMVWQRRRRLADLKLAGIDHRQLWKALLLESVVLLGVGCVVGTAYGLYGEQLLNRALGAATGFPVDNSIGVAVALLSLAVVVLVASAVAMVPGYLAARVPVDAAFRD
ncbi:MAG TPA: FtsX-like permease family protein [Conexibacter sp.]|nr:FtsX-like permease family protein [Conexibacter sp.]